MQLKDKFEAEQFVILAEMEPPKGVDVSDLIANATRVKGEVDTFVVPEMSNAVMRMSSLGASAILAGRGLPTVMQVNCRDRNRIALQADLLAANGCGVGAVMAVAGQDPSFGDHPQARSVYDIDLPELLGAVVGLREGRDMAGVELKGAPDLLVGSTVDIGVPGKSVEIELQDVAKKVRAGATFFVTPPIFDPDTLQPFLQRLGEQHPQAKLVVTVLLLKSLGMARYMARNVDHIHVPDELIKRIQGAPDKVPECIRIAAELVGAMKQAGCAGVMIATLGWEDRLPDVLRLLS